MLGHKMFQVLSDRYSDTWCTVREGCDDPFLRGFGLFGSGRVFYGVDAMNLDSLGELLRNARPAITVNCIGAIKHRSSAKSKITSITLNALLPHRVAAVVQEWAGRMIHFSTDCVFSGTRGNYEESDEPDARDVYGRTKQLGEVIAANALTIRTSFIGRELRHYDSLLEWFLAQNNRQAKGYTRSWWSGVTSIHLAELVRDLIEQQSALCGLYHIASARISKYELLSKLRDAFKLSIDIEPDDSVVCDRSLNGSRFAAATGYHCPSWDSLIAQLVNDPTPYDSVRGETV